MRKSCGGVREERKADSERDRRGVNWLISSTLWTEWNEEENTFYLISKFYKHVY